MVRLRLLAPLALLGALAPVQLGLTQARGSAARTRSASPYQSRELWATVDICGARDMPTTIGIRGSMPGDGTPHDTMFMRFRVQYEEAATHTWVDLPHGGDSGFVALGSARLVRQAGRSFQLVPVAGKPAYTLRGVVSFQWKRGGRVVFATSRTTTAGHKGVVGADPAGFSASTCVLG